MPLGFLLEVCAMEAFYSTVVLVVKSKKFCRGFSHSTSRWFHDPRDQIGIHALPAGTHGAKHGPEGSKLFLSIGIVVVQAMSRNGQYIGERYVKLLHVPKQEMEEQVKFGTAAIPKPGRAVPTCVAAPLLHPQIEQQFLGIPHHLGAPGSAQISIGCEPHAFTTRSPISYAQFSNLLWSVLGRMPIGLQGADLVQLGLGSSHIQAQLGLGSSHIQAQLSLVGMGPAVPIIRSPSGPTISSDGSTIRIRGLPFRATEAEVLSFFEGHQVLDGSVHLGVDTSGRPTGEGWVTFLNPEVAKKAVREKNRKYLQHRYLELSPLHPHGGNDSENGAHNLHI